MTSRYENSKIWKRVGSALGHRYASVPTEVPVVWTRGRDAARPEIMIYTSGEYVLKGRPYGTSRRRTWTVFRQGAELPLSFTGLLREAQERAVKNAKGEDRISVA